MMFLLPLFNGKGVERKSESHKGKRSPFPKSHRSTRGSRTGRGRMDGYIGKTWKGGHVITEREKESRVYLGGYYVRSTWVSQGYGECCSIRGEKKGR